MRPADVAARAGVSLSALRQAPLARVRAALTDHVPAPVWDALAAAPATFWQAGGRYFFDDEEFGDVAEVTDLSYDPALGMYSRRTFPGQD